MRSIEQRVRALEERQGLVELSDGSKFRPSHGFALLRLAISLEQDLEREPVLADFPPGYQELWRNFAKWTPGPEHGELYHMICTIAKRLVA